MLITTVKDWLSQSKNQFDIDCEQNGLFEIYEVQINKYSIYMEPVAALSVQMYDTVQTCPANKKLLVWGLEGDESDMEKIQQVAESANKTYLYKKNITAQVVSYKGYNLLVLRCK